MGFGSASLVVPASLILALSLSIFYQVTCEGGFLCLLGSRWTIPHTELWFLPGKLRANATRVAGLSHLNVTVKDIVPEESTREGEQDFQKDTSLDQAPTVKDDIVPGVDVFREDVGVQEEQEKADSGKIGLAASENDENTATERREPSLQESFVPGFGKHFSAEGRFSEFDFAAPAVEPPLPTRKHVHSILDFGGVGDGQKVNTAAFEQAVTKAAELAQDGGMQLNLPAGKWMTGCFNITNHFTLFLEPGARLFGQDAPGWPLLPPLPSYGQGREKEGPRYSSLIHGEHLEDIVITGQGGVIDGMGAPWWEAQRSNKLQYTRGCLIELQWSRNIIISNLNLQDAPFWHVHFFDCVNVTAHGLRITADSKSPNTDGINPDSSTDVLIQECFISTGDDAIAIKSGMDRAGVEYNRPSRNIVVRNLLIERTHGISIGSEMSGGVSNVLVKNITLTGPAATALRIKSASGRGGYVTNVTFEDVRIGKSKHGIRIYSTYGRDVDTPRADRDPVLEGVLVQNVVGQRVQRAGQFEGLEGSPLRHIVLRDVKLPPKAKAFACVNAEVEASNVTPYPSQCYNKRRRLVSVVASVLERLGRLHAEEPPDNTEADDVVGDYAD